MKLQSKFDEARRQLKDSLFQRDDEIDAVLRALVAQEHILFVGPPGTGKSLLANGLTGVIDGADVFEWLLTKVTMPEELFGPFSLGGLKSDRYERVTAGKLPECHIAFIDEVWKGSSTILNTLLTVMNERRFDNGTQRLDCPLRIMIAASNEWPIGEDYADLGAAFDRFLIRRHVRPINDAGLEDLIGGQLNAVSPCLTLDEIDQAATEARRLPVPNRTVKVMADIVRTLRSAGIQPGDRRIRKAVGVAKAEAWLQGATQVDKEHLECLGDVLWEDPTEQPTECRKIVAKIANPVSAHIGALLQQAEEIFDSVDVSDTRSPDLMGAIGKIKKIEEDLDLMASSPRVEKAQRYIGDRLIQLQNAIIGRHR